MFTILKELCENELKRQRTRLIVKEELYTRISIFKGLRTRINIISLVNV